MPEAKPTPENLAKLFYTYAYSRGHFLLSSGKTSSYYLNGKQVILSAQGLSISARLLLERIISSQPPEAIGGLSFGAAPLAAAVSAFSYCFPPHIPLSSFIVRKEAKDHGTHSRIEGPFYKGINTVIVDDVLTTGASVLSAVEAVEAAGGRVRKIFVLVDRLEGGRETLEGKNYCLESLATRRDLEHLDQLLQQKYPLFTTALDSKPVDWVRLAEGCTEIADSHPRLGSALRLKVTALQGEQGLLSNFSSELRAYLLRPLKIAEFSLDPKRAEEQASRALSIGFNGGNDS